MIIIIILITIIITITATKKETKSEKEKKESSEDFHKKNIYSNYQENIILKANLEKNFMKKTSANNHSQCNDGYQK